MRIPKRAIAILLLAAAVPAAVLLYLRRAPTAAQTAPVPDLISLAPSDAPFLLYADLAALRASPFSSVLEKALPAPSEDPEYARFVRDTGFDYERDLDRVVVAIRPAEPGTPVVSIAEGRFDRAKITSFALRSGKLERQGDKEAYVVPVTGPAKAVAFTFLGANCVAWTNGSNLAAALTPRAPGGFDPAMRERISRVSGAAVFAVGQVTGIPQDFSPGGMRSDQFTNLVRSLRWFSLAARPEGDHMKVAAEAECDTPENARQLAGTLDGLRLLGQAALSDPRTRQRLLPETLKLLDTLLRVTQVSRDNQRVRLILELTPEMLRATARETPAATAPAR